MKLEVSLYIYVCPSKSYGTFPSILTKKDAAGIAAAVELYIGNLPSAQLIYKEMENKLGWCTRKQSQQSCTLVQ